MIRLENLTLIFGLGTPDENTALENVSLSVKAQDYITIIGSNGAGKSSLFNAIAGTFAPHSGHIYLDRDREGTEHDITREPEYKRARYIGRIFQNPLLGTAGRMTLEDNMVICRQKGYRGLKISLNRKLREEFRAQLAELGMGLENRLTDNVELFSGGQRQALTLLMTVMSRPSLLLLDEHTAALDPWNAERVMELTMRFTKDYKLTVMMITHNMSQALEIGSRLLMMDRGEIILDLNAEEKSRLTTAGLVERFKDIRSRELAHDEMLLG
ncbi:MAG: ATP-binding cassette domain-containing protein [Treponema sp.]|nr:ATP-binding cassette domain-containing protein [Treponema sp.]